MIKSYLTRATFAGLNLCLLHLSAAPLAWFPGPAMDYPGSEAATVVMPGLGNVVIAGTTAYPEGLIATNIYWTPLGQPFYGVNIAPGAVASGGSIIVYGGNDGTSSVSTVINYSPSDGSSTLASMSVPRSYLGYAPDRNGNAYAIGGLDDSGNPLASAERLQSGQQAPGPPSPACPTARYDFPAVFNRTNYIYIFGGLTDTASGMETASVLRYSVSDNTWTSAGAHARRRRRQRGGVGAPTGKSMSSAALPAASRPMWFRFTIPPPIPGRISTPLPEGLSASAMGVDSLGRLIVMGGMDTNGNDVGDVWRSQQLGAPDSPPVFTQFPATNGIYQGPYTSTISATGNPQPVYSLVSGPDRHDGGLFTAAQSPGHRRGLIRSGPFP